MIMIQVFINIFSIYMNIVLYMHYSKITCFKYFTIGSRNFFIVQINYNLFEHFKWQGQ